MLVDHYGLPIRGNFDCGKGNCEECPHYDKSLEFCKYDDDYIYYKTHINDYTQIDNDKEI